MTLDTGNLGPEDGGPLLYQAYNAYETRVSQACSNSVVGCCSSNSLTRLVQDSSTTYNCWSPQSLPNDMLLQVKIFTAHGILNAITSCIKMGFVPRMMDVAGWKKWKLANRESGMLLAQLREHRQCFWFISNHRGVQLAFMTCKSTSSCSASQRCAWSGQHLAGWQQQSGRSIIESAALDRCQHHCRKHHSLFHCCQTHKPI